MEASDRRQEFLDSLRGNVGAPSEEPPEPPSPPTSPASPAPVAPTSPSAPPLSYEQAPPPPADVPAALSALAEDDLPSPPSAPSSSDPELMDLGTDGHMQGTALGLASIANRLEQVAMGLKLIPVLAAISRDLQTLNYTQASQAVDALIEWARGEEQSLMTSLEQRGSARRDATPE